MKIFTWEMIPFLLTNMNSLKKFLSHPAGEYPLREKGIIKLQLLFHLLVRGSV